MAKCALALLILAIALFFVSGSKFSLAILIISGSLAVVALMRIDEWGDPMRAHAPGDVFDGMSDEEVEQVHKDIMEASAAVGAAFELCGTQIRAAIELESIAAEMCALGATQEEAEWFVDKAVEASRYSLASTVSFVRWATRPIVNRLQAGVPASEIVAEIEKALEKNE